MNNLNNNNIKLAVQKNGRLTKETLEFLLKCGFDFDSSTQRLFSVCRNFPLEILYVRISDIPDYVATGVVDMGIIGQNLLFEMQPKVKKLLNLRFGFCRLAIAVQNESPIMDIKQLKDKKVSTSYPNSVEKFFAKSSIPVETVMVNGSVELAPALGVGEAIADLVSTGSTLALNDLREITTIYDSEAVLITNEKLLNKQKKKILIEKFITRCKGVLSASSYKYIMMNAPQTIVPRLKKIIPGLKSPTISSLGREGWVSVASVVKEDVFWETIEKLKKIGATGVIVLPIEKIIL